MRYKFTLLKDLPDFKEGTVVKCYGLIYSCLRGLCYELDEDGCVTYVPVGNSILDNPEWFRKEIDYDNLTDMKCPICGETRGVLRIQVWNNCNYDSDMYGIHVTPAFEYACGHPAKQLDYVKGIPDEAIKTRK